MTGRVYLGFDPGMSGAIAAIYPDGSAAVIDMPTVDTVRTRRDVVARELANIVAPLAVGGHPRRPGAPRGPGMIDRLTRILLAALRRLLVVDVVFFVLGGMWK